MEGKIVEVEDFDLSGRRLMVKTNYAESGQGDALILLHGFGASIYTWRRNIAELSRRFRVVALDLKGHGLTEKPPLADYSPEGFALFVRNFLASLSIEKGAVAGNSFGGAIGLLLALGHPNKVSKLILIDSAGYSQTNSFLFKMARVPAFNWLIPLVIGQRLVRSALRKVYISRGIFFEEAAEAYAEPLKKADARRAMAAILRRGLDPEKARFYERRFGEISCPTLIIWGAQDRVVPPAYAYRFHSDICGSRLVAIPGCGHAPHEEAPEAVNRAIVDFLTS